MTMQIRSLLKSATFRLAALYTILFTVSVVGLLGFVHYATAGYLARQTDAAIATEVAELANRYRNGGTGALAREISNKSAANIGGQSVYLLTDKEMNPIAGNISRWPEPVAPNASGWLEFQLDAGTNTAYPVRARAFSIGNGLHLLVGRNVVTERSFQRLIAGASAWGLGIAVALAIGGGFITSRMLARRLRRINQTAHEVMAGDLQQRVPIHGADDAFDRLSQNLNRMLDQIQDLMDGVRQVSDSIAHDLRTPLTHLRWRLERLQAGDDPDGTLLDQAIADADSLLTTFHALLRIAEVESGSRRRFARIDLSDLIDDVGELYEPVAAAHEQTLSVESGAHIRTLGDRDLLFQALTNLVDNAVKYAPSGGCIELAALETEAGPELVVADSGPGVPAEERENVLERFVRLETHRRSPGSGLGLSLVAAVAKLHSGDLLLEDNEPGLRVRMTLRTEEAV
jgi:signal transduction histidine kinase